MRVLHFFKTYYPDSFGGVERTIHAIASGALSYGIESEVLSLSREPIKNTVMYDGHQAHKAKLDLEFASTGFSRNAFTKFRELSSKVDVIHYHFPWPFMDVVHLLHTVEKPTIVTYHSDIVKQKTLLKLYTPLMHRFLSSVDRIVATSPNYLASSAVLKKYQDKTEVIPLGLREADYPKASDAIKTFWRSQFPRPFFLFVGVLRYYKGLHTLIAAAKDVDADILIVGKGPMENVLREQVASAGLTNIHFLGTVDDINKAALLEMCTAFVFPSHLRSEAYGLSLVEAAMFGRPMISCEIGTGTSFVNIDKVSGIVIQPVNASELKNAMNSLLLDEHLVATYGQGARAHFDSELDAKHMVKRYCTLYRSFL